MTGVAVARLNDSEAASLAGPHPQLAPGAAGMVLAFSVSDDREAQLLSLLVTNVRQYLADTSEAGEKLLAALLPEHDLRVSEAVLQQVALNGKARKALADEFGLLSSRDIARASGNEAGNAAQLAYRWRTSGRIFSIGSGVDTRYPGFQFDRFSQPRPAVAKVLDVLAGSLEGWDLALWFTGDNGWLGGARPVDVITGPAADADEDALLRAARELERELSAGAQTLLAADA